MRNCRSLRVELEAHESGFEAASAKEQRFATFKNHTALCGELIDRFVERKISGTFTFDSYLTNALKTSLRVIDTGPAPFVV